MTTSELIFYIKKQLNNNVSKELIISKLINVGWHQDDIMEGFQVVETEKNSEREKIWIPKNLPTAENQKDQNKYIVTQPIEIEKIKTETEIKSELIPTLIPKKEAVKIEIPKKEPIFKNESLSSALAPVLENQPTTNIKNSLAKNLPKSAMLSSYENDLLSINNNINSVQPEKQNKKIKRWFIVAIIILIVLGLGFLIVGYIKINNFQIPFIKKDPKVVILDNSKVLAELDSYKTETNIEITIPSFTSISSGLVNGEVVSSKDKDFILITNHGLVNQNEEGLKSNNFITVKGSLIENDINSEIKNVDQGLFIFIPSLNNQILKQEITEPAVVKIDKDQFNLLAEIFSEKTKIQLEKINLYKVATSGLVSFIDNKIIENYDEFITNAEIVEKEQEQIKGIDTYHYLINPKRDSVKNFLTKVVEDFVLDFKIEDNNKLSQILGSTTINSFEVWVGKGDNNIYQYSLVLDIPLSKVIGLEDKSIGDTKLNLSFKTTYFDFNIKNDISPVESYILMPDFVKNIKEKKVKNDLSNFQKLADELNKIENAYGVKSNPKGECMNPINGSLFSPLGHSPKSMSTISSISELLNNILGQTNGAGSCFSSPKAWSFSVPVSDTYDLISMPIPENQHYLCIDSTGSMKELVSLQTGLICQ